MKMTTGFFLALGLLLPSLGFNYMLRARLAAASASNAQAQAERHLAELNQRTGLAEIAALTNPTGQPTPELPACGILENGPSPCCSALSLAPQQIEAMSQKCATACEIASTSGAEAEQVVKDLENCLSAPTVDRERIHSLLDRLFVLRRQELESKVDAILTVRDSLTPEQIEKLKALLRGKE